MARSSDGRSALERSLQILDAFDVDAAFLTVSECAARADIPISSAHRLLTELTRHGLVERLPDRTYRIGLRLWELACRTPGALGLREIAMPTLQAVQAAIGQHTQLAVLAGHDALFIERLSAADAVVNFTLVGGRLPATLSSSGHVLIAQLPPEQQAEMLSAPLPVLADGTPLSGDDLRRRLHEARQLGYSALNGWFHKEALGIAVPIRGASGEVVAALGVVVPTDTRTATPIAEFLKGAAAEIATSLQRAALPDSHPDAFPGGRYRSLVHSSNPTMRYLAQHSRPASGSTKPAHDDPHAGLRARP